MKGRHNTMYHLMAVVGFLITIVIMISHFAIIDSQLINIFPYSILLMFFYIGGFIIFIELLSYINKKNSNSDFSINKVICLSLIIFFMFLTPVSIEKFKIRYYTKFTAHKWRNINTRKYMVEDLRNRIKGLHIKAVMKLLEKDDTDKFLRDAKESGYFKIYNTNQVYLPDKRNIKAYYLYSSCVLTQIKTVYLVVYINGDNEIVTRCAIVKVDT